MIDDTELIVEEFELIPTFDGENKKEYFGVNSSFLDKLINLNNDNSLYVTYAFGTFFSTYIDRNNNKSINYKDLLSQFINL